MKKSTHKILRFIVRLLMNLIARISVTGFEGLPSNGGVVVAANHIGRLDAALVYYVLDRPDIIIIVAEKYEKYALTRWLTRLVNGIFIDRYHADASALRQSLRRLQQGGIFAMTPEGTRSKSGNLIEAKPGGMFLAWKAGVPILPVAVTGTEDDIVRQQLKRLRRLDIKIVAGKPFSLSKANSRDRDSLLQSATDEVMCQIAALLPPSRRGYYTDHPRLKEILEKTSK